jgi:hypothetical protein
MVSKNQGGHTQSAQRNVPKLDGIVTREDQRCKVTLSGVEYFTFTGVCDVSPRADGDRGSQPGRKPRRAGRR